MGVKHTYQSGKADGGDSTLVQPSNWNADHTITEITGAQNGQTPLTLTNWFLNFVGSTNAFYQAAFQNKSAGASASTDVVCTTDTGTDAAEYIDMGINGSGFSGSWGGPKDGYLYVDGGASGVGDLIIGTQQANTFLDINVGGGGDANRVVRFSSTGTLWTAFTSDPSTPPADTIHFYMKKIAGRVMPKWMGPSGVDTPAQPFLGMNCCRIIGTGTGTTTALVCSWQNIQIVCVGNTLAQTTPTTGSLKSRMRLSSLQSAATGGAIASVKGSQLECARETGFFYVCRFALDTLIATNLGFWGLYASATAPAATIDFTTSTAVAKVGLAINSNTGNWKLVQTNGTNITATDLGASFPVNNTDVMELVMFSAPGGSGIGYRVTNLSTGATTSGTMSTYLPGNTTYLCPLETLSNNATASAVKWSHKVMYLETDY